MKDITLLLKQTKTSSFVRRNFTGQGGGVWLEKSAGANLPHVSFFEIY